MMQLKKIQRSTRNFSSFSSAYVWIIQAETQLYNILPKAPLATAMPNLWWRDRQDTEGEGLAAGQRQARVPPCIWIRAEPGLLLHGHLVRTERVPAELALPHPASHSTPEPLRMMEGNHSHSLSKTWISLYFTVVITLVSLLSSPP